MSGPRYAGEFFAGRRRTAEHRQPGHLRDHHEQPAGAAEVSAVRADVRHRAFALIFRAIFIALGAAAIERFSWVFFLFGAFLIWTAWKLFMDYLHPEDDDEKTENFAMRWVKRTFPPPTTTTAPGSRSWSRASG